MKLITPPIASEPYTAEAPSRRISTRSSAASGIELRSYSVELPSFGSAYATGVIRRPLSRISVELDDSPRSEAVDTPRENPPSLVSRFTSDPIDGTRRISSVTVEAPVSRMSFAVMIWMGWVPSFSVRFRFDPVTYTVCAPSPPAFCADAYGDVAMAMATAMTLYFRTGGFIDFLSLRLLLSEDVHMYPGTYNDKVSQRDNENQTIFYEIRYVLSTLLQIDDNYLSMTKSLYPGRISDQSLFIRPEMFEPALAKKNPDAGSIRVSRQR